MNRLTQIVLAAAVVCAGCSNSSDYKQNTPVASSPPPAPVQTDFSNFVVLQFGTAASAETAPSVDVNALNFTFADDNNPAIFDGVIAANP